MEPAVEGAEEDPGQDAEGQAGDHRGGHLEEGGGGEGAALGKAGEGGEEDDDEDVVHRRPGQDELGDAVVGAVALLHEPEHPGHHHGGGDGGHHGPHDGGVQQGDAQEGRGQQKHPRHLEAGGDETHEDGGPANPFEVVHLEGEAGPGEDDDEGQLPQVGGDA